MSTGASKINADACACVRWAPLQFTSQFSSVAWVPSRPSCDEALDVVADLQYWPNEVAQSEPHDLPQYMMHFMRSHAVMLVPIEGLEALQKRMQR